MGSPQHVFNSVALIVESFIDKGVMDEPTGQRILESLINALRVEMDWRDPDETLQDYFDTPYIIQAFENNGVKIEGW